MKCRWLARAVAVSIRAPTPRINVNIVADRDRFLEAGRQRNAEAARRELERTQMLQADASDFEHSIRPLPSVDA